MKFVFFLLAFSMQGYVFAQIEDETVRQAMTKKFSKFIPNGAVIFDTACSDFNKDGLTDMLLVTTSEAATNDTRGLIILQNSIAGFIVSAKCANAVFCEACGGIFGDPYAGISFTKNVLTINHYGGSAWRWTSNFTFRFQNKQWELIGISLDSYWNVDDCNGKGVGYAGQNLKEVNFSTKKMHLIETAENQCTPKTDKWVTVKSYKKVSLDDFDVQEDYFKYIHFKASPGSSKGKK